MQYPVQYNNCGVQRGDWHRWVFLVSLDHIDRLACMQTYTLLRMVVLPR